MGLISIAFKLALGFRCACGGDFGFICLETGIGFFGFTCAGGGPLCTCP